MEINGVFENIVKVLTKTYTICVVSVPEKIKLLLPNLSEVHNWVAAVL